MRPARPSSSPQRVRRVERVPEPFLTYVEGPDPAHDPAAPPQRHHRVGPQCAAGGANSRKVILTHFTRLPEREIKAFYGVDLAAPLAVYLAVNHFDSIFKNPIWKDKGKIT